MKRATSVLLITAFYLSLISPLGLITNGQALRQARSLKYKTTANGLKFSLSEGTEGADERTKKPPADATSLSESDTEALTRRLPLIKTDGTDKKDFAKRLGSLPAPKTGKRIKVKFPSDESMSAPLVEGGKDLKVVRFSPEGPVALAGDLSVTFSVPMVAVTSQIEAAETVPVELEPRPAGKWRWLGTRTLMFDAPQRFPMATIFTAKVPAGTKSANGKVLGKELTWTFTTPPPKLLRHFPSSNSINRRNALIFVSFDQRVDPAAMLRKIAVTAGGRRIPTRLATKDEIKGSRISYYAKNAEPGRWLALRALNSEGGTKDALPPDSRISVMVQKGAPSAEGPLTTTKRQSFGFRTYGAMKFVEGHCGYRGNKNCSPFETWYLRFTNSIDATKFDKSMITIAPEIEGARIYPSGQYIYVQGFKKGRTTYTVKISDKIGDVFNQRLTEPATVRIKVGEAPKTLFSQGGQMVVLDPAVKRPAYSIYSTNHRSVRVKIYRVRPQDWSQFQKFVRYRNYDDGTKVSMPGRLVSNRTVRIKYVPDEMVETRLDLRRVLGGRFGSVVVDIEPTVKANKYDRTRITTWVQATGIGLDAFVDSSQLVGFATDLATGKPLAGVRLGIYPNGVQISRRTERKTEESYFESLWNWISGTVNGGPADVESVGEDGRSVATETIDESRSDVTPRNGILRLPLPMRSAKEPNLLIAKKGRDTAFLPENSEYYWRDNGSWYKRQRSDYLRWFVFDDRKMYRPKEEVSVKGYIRRIEAGKLGDVQPLGDSARGLNYSVRDARNNEIAKGKANLNAFGAFDLKFRIPDNANLGYTRVHLSTATGLGGGSYTHTLQVQEFRRPEFEVSSKVVTEAPHFVGGHANVEVEAKYYAGGGLANADVNWTVRANPTNYTPPNRGDFIFGSWVPWWYASSRGRGYGGSTQGFKGVTDASGKHNLKIDFESVRPPRPYNITASASVQDVNRQTWSSTATLLVHPADLYVGIRSPRSFVQKGEAIKIESIVSDLDGDLVEGKKAELKAVLKSWQFEKGKWVEKTVDEQFCTVTSGEKPKLCRFIAKQGGRYIISALVMDDRERFNESEMTVWVAGGKTPPKRKVEKERVELIPGAKEYAPGESAEMLVISPFSPAEGVLTLRREGIVETRRFSIKGSSVTLRIPIKEAYLPNIHAQVDLVGSAARTDDKGEIVKELSTRPAFASGALNFQITKESRKLNVKAEPRDKTVEPAGKTTIDIAVTDKSGEPAADSEVAVVVVDESVLALSNYRLADPVSVFYSNRGSGTTDFHLRQEVQLGNPEDVKPKPPPPNVSGRAAGDLLSLRPGLAAPAAKAGRRERAMVVDEMEAADMKTEDDRSGSGDQISLRKNFDALAVFAPSVRTNSYGRATVSVKLPDNLTRYRVMAVSVDKGKRFGKGESAITARKPLMVRPSAPRFMNFGDKVELPVVIQNQTDRDMTVNVGMRATNALITAGGGRRVLVKANDREEVRFPVSADMAGTARFQFAASSGKYTDAAEIKLPVWTPATTEAFATYGTTDRDGAIVQPVRAPGDVYPQFGGLEVTTSSTQLQELTDAFIYLYRYRFACTEQISSRMISVAALRDVLSAFKAEEMPTEAQIKAQFANDIKILRSRQNSNGYFGLWRKSGERYKYPFITAHTAHALILAKQKGYKVPEEMLRRVAPYLKNIEKHFDRWHTSPRVRWTISAYALYVRNLMGDNDSGKAKKLLREATISKMPFEALGWLLPVLVDGGSSSAEISAIKRYLLNRTSETAATAQFNTDYGDGAWVIMYSNRRADGVLLEALLKTESSKTGRAQGADATDLIPKLVRGLLDHRKKGRWGNTQENVFILLALDKYFHAYEQVTPNFVNRVWLGKAYAGEQRFRGRSVDSNQLEIPMSYLMKQGGAADLIMGKKGPGRLYYRIGMKYAPKNLKLKPADYGFTVLRSYQAVDDKEDVQQGPDGKWVIKAGARVRVKLTMVAQARRYHVALVDPLPAGLEILNPDLAVTETIPAAKRGNTPVIEVGSRSFGSNYYFWRSRWFEHQNFRDERAEAFASLLWSGVYTYTYVARATTPGEFVVPPAKAEEMYHPETFGRTGTDMVIVR